MHFVRKDVLIGRRVTLGFSEVFLVLYWLGRLYARFLSAMADGLSYAEILQPSLVWLNWQRITTGPC